MEAAELPLPFPLDDARTRLQLGALLVRDGLLTPRQLELALAEKHTSGRRLGEIVVDCGWVSPQLLAGALAEQHGLTYTELAQTRIDAAAAALLPERFARRYEALPIRFLGLDTVLVAIADPTDVLTADDLRLALGLNVRFTVVASTDLMTAIGGVHGSTTDIRGDRNPVVALSAVRAGRAVEDERGVGAAPTAPAIELVNSLIARAIDEQASDLHFEPAHDGLSVRGRVDGVMRSFGHVRKELQAAVIGRLKIMGDLDIAERRAPQDGRVSVRIGGRPTDLRIAVLPTTHGEQVVLRLLHRAGTRRVLSDLGMSPVAEETFARAIRQPYGAVIVCGPTGSGKTTTLYSALDQLNDAERVLTTIEDPVEYRLPGVSQIEVNPKSGLTFARGLRTILRSDPDVLMVGEIRDEETARIAVQAAMTGHLVLTTLHTHNAASSIARLKDMGIEPGLLVAAVNCIVAQRLVRRLCEECREPYHPSGEELSELGIEPDSGPAPTVYRAVGCQSCNASGYSGRVALYEIMPSTRRIRRLLEASTEEIFAAAVDEGMETLRQAGGHLWLAGISSADEIRRVTGDLV